MGSKVCAGFYISPHSIEQWLNATLYAWPVFASRRAVVRKRDQEDQAVDRAGMAGTLNEFDASEYTAGIRRCRCSKYSEEIQQLGTILSQFRLHGKFE